MKETNCPNCGAPITGRTCEYCGTRFSKEEPTIACDCSGFGMSLRQFYMEQDIMMTIDEVRESLDLLKRGRRGIL